MLKRELRQTMGGRRRRAGWRSIGAGLSASGTPRPGRIATTGETAAGMTAVSAKAQAAAQKPEP